MKINIIHDYHYTKVKETDKKTYTRIMGIALIVVLDVLSGVTDLFIYGTKSGIVFVTFFIIGILMILYDQIEYNHGLF